MFIRLSIIIAILFIGSISASPDLKHPLMLSELVDVAMENHPATKQAWWNAKRAAAAVGIAKAPYYPQLDFESYVSHGREFKYVNGPDTNYTIVGADFILSMLLYDFGETDANVCAAKAALLAANWQTDWTMQSVLINVLENAYAMLHAQEVVLATRFSLEDAERTLKASIELNQAGLTPITDVHVSKAAYAQMQMELAEKNAYLDIQNGKLAASLGLAADTHLELAHMKEIPIPRSQNDNEPKKAYQISELIQLANQQRADLMAKRARLTETFAKQQKIKAAYRPKFAFTGSGGADYAFHDKERGLHYDLTLNLSVSLFTGFQAFHEKKMALAESKLAAEELAELELDISLEVLSHTRMLEATEELLPLAENDLDNSQKAYEGMLEIYKGGKERITAVSNAQRQLAMSRVRYSDIKTRWLIAIAKLAYSTGTLDPYLENPCTRNP